MRPKRKKTKSNPDEPAEETAAETDNGQNETTTNPTTNHSTTQNDTPAAPSPAPSTSRWSWSARAAPTSQIARESVSVAQGTTSESSESAHTPSSVSKSVRGSRKSIPLVAEATKVHATSNVSRRYSTEKKSNIGNGTKGEETKELGVEDAQLPPEPVLVDAKSLEAAARQSWFGGWWSRPDGYASDAEPVRKSKKQKLDSTAETEASNTPLPGTTPTEEVGDVGQKIARDFEGVGTLETTKPDDASQSGTNANATSARSWFGLWSSAQNQKVEASKAETVQEPPDITVSAEQPNVEDAVKPAEPTTTDDKKETEEKPKTSGWAFWSSDTKSSKDPTPTPGGTQKQIGELAVADSPSQSHPEPAQFNEQREDQKPIVKPIPKRTGSLLRPGRGRPEKAQVSSGESSTIVQTPADGTPAITPAISQVPTPSETPPPPSSSRESSEPPKKMKTIQPRPNLILPSFQDSFAPAPNPGWVERLTDYLATTLHLPGSTPSRPLQHVFIAPSPPIKIKRAVALGIHGFFPGPLVQKVLGQPTGTSIRFANYAASAIQTWCAERQPEIKNVEVHKVALEGEGYIADRVTTLWKLLLNWLQQLREADFVLLACHSQGVPVAIMLLAKLIQLGCLAPNARVGVAAMAGINLGPFLEYKSRLFGGTSAFELFDFCYSDSKVSLAYKESLDVCLRAGCRVTFVGSLDDQLVSIESSLHAPLTHPYVARAVFIDGRLHAPNFLTHLVIFALKLRNLGVNDHGLLRELSAPLAGSLVGGEGHSRIYDDPAVYRLAVDFALESTDMQPLSSLALQSEKDKAKDTSHSRRNSFGGAPPSPAQAGPIRRGSLTTSSTSLSGLAPVITAYEPPPSSTNANPFFLPWAVRGMLEEDLVKKDPRLKEEVEVLVREFEEWKPTSKVLRDVRWRLEGVRSMM